MEIDIVYNEDVISGMAKIPDASVDLIVTDPPYLINYQTKRRLDKDHRFSKPILNDNNVNLIEEYIKECFRISKNNTALYMFCSSKTIDTFLSLLRGGGYTVKNIIVWDKGAHTAGDLQAQFGQRYEFLILANKGRRLFNGKRIDDIWMFPRVVGKSQVHQNQKPVELIRQCIEKHSDPGDLVFDGFMGSGTTAIACIDTGRHYLGFELDAEYYRICNNRILDREFNLQEV